MASVHDDAIAFLLKYIARAGDNPAQHQAKELLERFENQTPDAPSALFDPGVPAFAPREVTVLAPTGELPSAAAPDVFRPVGDYRSPDAKLDI